MKSLNITGTLVTEKTVEGYIRRMMDTLYNKMFDMASMVVLDEIETKCVEAGLITWERIGELDSEFNNI